MNNTILFLKHKRLFMHFFIFLVCFLLLTGCVKYQYITVESKLDKNENKEFVEETDAVKLKYSFTGTDFPLTINIFNKLQQPLYIDLRSSKVIMNDQPIEGSFIQEKQIDSIAPQSFTVIKSNNLSDKFIPLTMQDKTSNTMVSTSNGSKNVTMHQFDESTSPVYLRSVLVVSNKPDFSTTVNYDHSFWVSGVIQNYDTKLANLPSNQFYLEQTSGFAKFMGCTFAVIVLLALAAITPAEQ
jgi:hypothetical protein